MLLSTQLFNTHTLTDACAPYGPLPCELQSIAVTCGQRGPEWSLECVWAKKEKKKKKHDVSTCQDAGAQTVLALKGPL